MFDFQISVRQKVMKEEVITHCLDNALVKAKPFNASQTPALARSWHEVLPLQAVITRTNRLCSLKDIYLYKAI